jgi:hypothetical protein
MRLLEEEVDLRNREPGQFDVELEVDEALQLDCQELLVPAGLLGELVVSQDIGPLFGLAHQFTSAEAFVRILHACTRLERRALSQ